MAVPHAFLAGEGIPYVIKLLPQITWSKLDTSAMAGDLPPDMPVGAYDVILMDADGSREKLSNGLKVRPLPSKKKFTMEDFQKILKAKQEKARKAKSQEPEGN